MDNVDFLPDRMRTQRVRRGRLMRQGYLLATCLVSLALLGHFRQERVAKARGELALLGERQINIQKQLEMRTRLEAERAELLIMRRIEEHLGSRADTLDVLGELQRVLPESIALKKLDLETTDVGLKLTSVGRRQASARARAAYPTVRPETQTVKRLRLTLKGLAPTDVDVANFIGQLSASPLLEGVNMGYAKNVEIGHLVARQFQASCYVAR